MQEYLSASEKDLPVTIEVQKLKMFIFMLLLKPFEKEINSNEHQLINFEMER